MPLCGQHVATDPSSVSPVNVAVISLPPSMEPIHHYSVSPSPCHFAAFVMSREVLSEAPSISREVQEKLPVLAQNIWVEYSQTEYI